MNGQDSAVQTVQASRSMPEPMGGQGRGAAVCLRSPRGGKLRVVRAGSDAHAELVGDGWEVDDLVCLARECPCGCGLPLPFPSKCSDPIQKYADPEGCRKAVYSLMHPTLDLSGMTIPAARRAARMAHEAVVAARLGQARATVDADAPVTHKAVLPDERPSNRLRLSERHWQMLGEIKALGYHQGESYSAIVAELIEAEAELCRARVRQEEEHG